MQINDWERARQGRCMDAIIGHLRMLPENPLDSHPYGCNDARSQDVAVGFLESLLPDDFMAAWDTMEKYSYTMGLRNKVRVLVPDAGSPSAYSGLTIQTHPAVLRGADRPIITNKQPGPEWYAWIEAQRKLNEMLSAVARMKDMMHDMNTYGQVKRLWSGTPHLMDEEIAMALRAQAVSSRFPKGFELPEDIWSVRRHCDTALDQVLLFFGKPRELHTAPQQNRIVTYSPKDSTNAERYL